MWVWEPFSMELSVFFHSGTNCKCLIQCKEQRIKQLHHNSNKNKQEPSWLQEICMGLIRTIHGLSTRSLDPYQPYTDGPKIYKTTDWGQWGLWTDYWVRLGGSYWLTHRFQIFLWEFSQPAPRSPGVEALLAQSWDSSCSKPNNQPEAETGSPLKTCAFWLRGTTPADAL